MNDFVKALHDDDLELLRQVPKSDLHNHSMMGFRVEKLEKFYGSPVAKFTNGHQGVHGINEWIGQELQKVFSKEGAFEFAIGEAFLQAVSDGITVLEMSVDAFLMSLLQISPVKMVEIIKQAHSKNAPDIDFRAEIGIARKLPVRTILPLFDKFLETGYFRSVDLYDIEDAQPVENFRELYRYAKNAGLKCKAHAGEFGDAEFVRKSVEVLGLDEVQHGIGAAESEEVMKWLAEGNVRLNVCPESNICLRRAESYKTHPLRILFDHGLKVTVNTDDVMLFEAGNSEQYLNLYRSGSFSAEELDIIRKNGLE